MKLFPSHVDRIPGLGIRQIEQEYQQAYASRVWRVRVSRGALLLAVATHVVLVTDLVISIIKQGSVFHVEHIGPYLGASACVLPCTWFLARLYAHSRADARLARTRLIELQSLMGRKGRTPSAE